MSKYVTYYVFLLLKVVYYYSYEVGGSLQNDIETQLRNGNGTNLSRERRYLVFPEGSSFQVVFDLAYPTLDGIGLYVFGNTAGLAWELPSKPIFLDKKHHKHEEPMPTTTMLPHLEHPVEYEHDDHDWQPPLSWDDTHKLDYQYSPGSANEANFVPNYGSTYSSKFDQIDRSPVSSYSNPFDNYNKKGFNPQYTASNRYPVHYVTDGSREYSGDQYRLKPNNLWNRRSFQNRRKQVQTKPTNSGSYGRTADSFYQDLHHNIHRRTRRDLYEKLEEFLSALIKDGKACILKTICQVNKIPKGKGTLVEELIKTIFKVKPDDFHADEDHYDQAANTNHNCDEMFSECEGNILSKLLRSAFKK